MRERKSLSGMDIDVDRLGAALSELGRGIEAGDIGTTDAAVVKKVPCDDFATIELTVEYHVPNGVSDLVAHPIQYTDIEDR